MSSWLNVLAMKCLFYTSCLHDPSLVSYSDILTGRNSLVWLFAVFTWYNIYMTKAAYRGKSPRQLLLKRPGCSEGTLEKQYLCPIVGASIRMEDFSLRSSISGWYFMLFLILGKNELLVNSLQHLYFPFYPENHL